MKLTFSELYNEVMICLYDLRERYRQSREDCDQEIIEFSRRQVCGNVILAVAFIVLGTVMVWFVFPYAIDAIIILFQYNMLLYIANFLIAFVVLFIFMVGAAFIIVPVWYLYRILAVTYDNYGRWEIPIDVE